MPSDPLQNKVITIMAVKEVYNKLLNKIRKPSTAQKTIEAVLHTRHQLAQDLHDSSKGYIRYHLTNFQFKILNNILYLNKKISKFDLNVSPLCSLCNHPEDVPHLFCNCAKT